MKVPQPDINKQIVDTFIAKTGANRKLKRLWGTTTVDDNGTPTEVLHARRHYHKASARPENYETLFKFLKVYEDVKDYEGEGIKSAWFTLNKSNSEEVLDLVGNYVTDNLNRMWWDDSDGPLPENLTLTTTIVVSESFGRSTSITGIDWSGTKEEISQYVVDNYETLWANNKIEQEGVGVINKGSTYDPINKIEVPDEDDLSPDDPWLSIVSRYALRTSGIPCTVKDVEVGVGRQDALYGAESVFTTAVITIEIPYHEFDITDPIVQRIEDDLDTTVFKKVRKFSMVHGLTGFNTSNENLTQSSAKQINYYEAVDEVDADLISRDYLQWEESATQDSVYKDYWVKVGKLYYLKVDVINNPKAYGTTHTELNTYLFSILDTGYQKKKVKWYKKVIAIVVFIIAVVLAFVPGAQGLSAVLANAAMAVIIGALVVSLATMALSAMGMTDWAMAFAWASKAIAPLVLVATIVIAVTTGVDSGSFFEAAKDYAMSELNSELFNLVLGEFGEFGELIADAMTGTIDPSTLDVIASAATAYSNVQLKKLDTIASKNKGLQAESDALAEANKEAAMTNDVMMSYMNIYAKPATADQSVYAATFDMPYEGTAGSRHTGCIQKTTVNAMRKSDFKEPMFEGMLFA